MHRHRILIGAVAAASVSLAACGSSSPTGAPTTATASVSGTFAAQSTVPPVVTSAPSVTTGGPDLSPDTEVPASTAASTTAAPKATDAPLPDIVDTATTAASFGTLLAAVQAAGLVETLKSAGPFTVFAPTDEAFAKLPAGLLEALLKPENNEVLVKVLTYHVVSGKVLAADLIPGKISTVEGSALAVSTEGQLRVDFATVVQADVLAANGVIQIIDTVLLPADVDTASLLPPPPTPKPKTTHAPRSTDPAPLTT